MIKTWFLAAALISRLMAFTPFMVDGPSMLPTLQSGSLFVLDKDAYKDSEPQRGDIVVFAFEKKPDYFYVKRVVGLPGERVHVTSNGLYLEEQNGRENEVQEPYLAHAQGNDKNFALRGFKDQIFVVPSGKYLVLGDNRAHSLDSRSFIYPFVPKENIKGKYIITLSHP